MKKFFLVLFIFIFNLINYNKAYITWIEAKYPLKGHPSKPGTPWPLPKQIITSNRQFNLNPLNFDFYFNDAFKCDIIEKSLKRYKSIIFLSKKKIHNINSNLLERVNIRIDFPKKCDYPRFNDDESYEIDFVDKENQLYASITSRTVWGNLRGLETFSQLVYTTSENDLVRFYINLTYIVDSPAFSYRGLMLDTSRHYLPISTIIAHLNLMSFNKMNVFHWHIVDDQSWPFESKVHPELHLNGSYSKKHIYNQNQISYIIEYARLLGIRVLPELDSPGHTFRLPQKYLTACYGKRTEDIINKKLTIEEILKQKVNRNEYGPPFTEFYGQHYKYEILNPSLNETYDYMLDLYKEFKKLFKDKFIHLGMDEVYYACWLSNPDIIEWMQKNNFTQINQIEEYYVKRTMNNIKNKIKNNNFQIWQDPLDNNVKIDKDAIIQVWKGIDNSTDFSKKTTWQEYAYNVTKMNFRMILSSCYYLNYIQYQSPNNDWEKYYNCNPRSFSNDPKQKKLVVGAEACVWSEYVDASNSISRTWPRASAAAERFWSNPQEYDIDNVRYRLDDIRCLMLKRGYLVAPILNGYCEI